jgi:hypothetical protein
MKPPPSILRPMAFATAAPTVASPVQGRIDHSLQILAKSTSQLSHLNTQSVVEYLVGTLRKTW